MSSDRWRDLDTFKAAVFAAVGSAPEVIEPGRLHRFTTNGRPGDMAGWCQFFDDGRAGVFGCWREGTQGVWTATDRRSLNPAQAADLARQVKAAAVSRAATKRAGWGESAGRLAAVWAACKPVQADGMGTDPVTLYLRHRLALAPGEALAVPDVIRWHPGLSYRHEGAFMGTWPAMVAGLQGPDGAAVALHRTWLTPEGRKAPTPGPVKKLSSAAGPVMTLYLLSMALPKQEFMGTGAWFFFIINLTKVPIYVGLGMIDAHSLALGATLIPGIVIGATLLLLLLVVVMRRYRRKDTSVKSIPTNEPNAV